MYISYAGCYVLGCITGAVALLIGLIIYALIKTKKKG